MIYVVDDESSVAEIVSLGLRVSGYQAVVFTNPKKALEAFRSADPKPRLLVSDYNMPEMSGLELLSECRAICPGLKAISLSGNLSSMDLSHVQEKPDALLPKPVAISEVLATVRRLLAG